MSDAREADIAKIVDVGRRTRRPTPRWLWLAAASIGVICAAGFAIAMLGQPAPSDRVAERPEPRPAGRSGFAAGLAIGAGAGIVIGYVIARQRRSHSSRSSP